MQVTERQSGSSPVTATAVYKTLILLIVSDGRAISKYITGVKMRVVVMKHKTEAAANKATRANDKLDIQVCRATSFS